MSESRDKVIVDIQKMINEMPNSESYHPKIFKVYSKLRKMNEGAYDPVLVAIGPIHHNKDHLKDMEKVKVSYLRQFLRVKNQTVDRYVVKLRELEERARNCYSNFIQLPETDEFVKMLLLDGFFVIMLLRNTQFRKYRVEKDPIIESSQVRNRVILDIMLVENQLPFFILSELFDMTKTSHPKNNLRILAVKYLCWMFPWKKDVDSLKIDDQNVDDHLLGMVYGAYFSTETVTQCKEENLPEYHHINSASELEESGIQFKKAKGGVMDVGFTSTHGVMQLSHLSIDDYTETLLRQLIAYEQMFPDNTGPRYVTEYTTFMSDLLRSSKDVEILRKAEILENWVADDRILCEMFNQLEKHIIIFPESFRYLEVLDQVNKHCSRRRNNWMATLRRDYFNSPWAILSVIAAVILLLLTALQTGFTIFPSE